MTLIYGYYLDKSSAKNTWREEELFPLRTGIYDPRFLLFRAPL